MFEVPAPTVKTNETKGATSVMRRGLAWMMREAILTSQSMPPAACIAADAVMTAMMMKKASTGGDPGSSWKPNTRMAVPAAPHKPRPIPPIRTPRKMAPRTTIAWRMTETESIDGLLLATVRLGDETFQSIITGPFGCQPERWMKFE